MTFLQIFNVTTPLSDYLQTKNLDFAQAWRLIESATERLKDLRNRFYETLEAAHTFVRKFNEKIEASSEFEDLKDLMMETTFKKSRSRIVKKWPVFIFFSTIPGGEPPDHPRQPGGYSIPHPTTRVQLVGALTTPVHRPFDVSSTGLDIASQFYNELKSCSVTLGEDVIEKLIPHINLVLSKLNDLSKVNSELSEELGILKENLSSAERRCSNLDKSYRDMSVECCELEAQYEADIARLSTRRVAGKAVHAICTVDRETIVQKVNFTAPRQTEQKFF
ncbi:hypothetical protein J6590_083271 [Homalodisca vitripennis]|nr:hypothetical protein J6590_083271 [Homalodisca vitripennis]